MHAPAGLTSSPFTPNFTATGLADVTLLAGDTQYTPKSAALASAGDAASVAASAAAVSALPTRCAPSRRLHVAAARRVAGTRAACGRTTCVRAESCSIIGDEGGGALCARKNIRCQGGAREGSAQNRPSEKSI
jgi:hypothetical protein